MSNCMSFTVLPNFYRVLNLCMWHGWVCVIVYLPNLVYVFILKMLAVYCFNYKFSMYGNILPVSILETNRISSSELWEQKN